MSIANIVGNYQTNKRRSFMELSGWIVYNGSLPGTKFIDFAQMFQEAASRKNMTTILYRNDELIANIHAQELGIYRIRQRYLSDYVIFTDINIYLIRELVLLGVHFINRYKSI